MDISDEFPMLVCAVDVCTDEGYFFICGDEDGIRIGRYQPDWLRIRTSIIDYYQER